MSVNLDEVKNATRQKLGDDASLDYITEELVQAAIANAESVDENNGEAAPQWGKNYGNSVFESGGVTYWQASSRPSPSKSEGCGSNYYQSRYITSTDWVGSCPNGSALIALYTN